MLLLLIFTRREKYMKKYYDILKIIRFGRCLIIKKNKYYTYIKQEINFISNFNEISHAKKCLNNFLK